MGSKKSTSYITVLILKDSQNSPLYVNVRLYIGLHVLKYLFIKRELCPSGSLLKYWYHLFLFEREYSPDQYVQHMKCISLFIYCSQTLSFLLLRNINSGNILENKPRIISRNSSIAVCTSVLSDKEWLCREMYNAANQREKIEMIPYCIIFFLFFEQKRFFHVND